MNYSNKHIKDGFTLIELLVILLLLSIIVGISIFFAIRVINISKEKSYKITINNIENISNSYAIENSDDFEWGVTDDRKNEYYCLTVGDLIDNGFLDNNVIDSRIDDNKNVSRNNYIYLERDSSTKALNKNKLIIDEDSDYMLLCNDIKYYQNKYLIRYDSNGGEGIMEDTECEYNGECTLRENTFTRDGYIFLGWSTLKNNLKVEYQDEFKFVYTKTENITLYAVWMIENKVIIKYNTNGGNITSSSETTYNLEVDDNGLIFVNGDTLITSINYGDSLGDSGLNNCDNNFKRTGYNIIPNKEWICISGECAGKIYDQDKIYEASDFCDALNGDCTVELGINWEAKIVKVTFDKNDGSGNKLSQMFTYGKSGNRFGYNTDGTVKWEQTGKFGGWDRVGYTLLGWSISKTATSPTYNIYSNVTDNWIDENSPDITLYAIWKINTVTIKYNVNELKFTLGGKYNWTTTNSGTIKKSGNVLTTVIEYNKSTSDSGLINYNDSNYLKITAKGQLCGDWKNLNVKKTKEWKCKSGECRGKIYNQNKVYEASDFCDLKNNSCTVELGVNWYYTSLDLNGYLDGQIKYDIKGYGTADIYVNGKKIANDVSDYCDYTSWKYGDTYEIKDIKAFSGKKFMDNVYAGSLRGTIGDNKSSVYLEFKTK